MADGGRFLSEAGREVTWSEWHYRQLLAGEIHLHDPRASIRNFDAQAAEPTQAEPALASPAPRAERGKPKPADDPAAPPPRSPADK